MLQPHIQSDNTLQLFSKYVLYFTVAMHLQFYCSVFANSSPEVKPVFLFYESPYMLRTLSAHQNVLTHLFVRAAKSRLRKSPSDTPSPNGEAVNNMFNSVFVVAYV